MIVDEVKSKHVYGETNNIIPTSTYTVKQITKINYGNAGIAMDLN